MQAVERGFGGDALVRLVILIASLFLTSCGGGSDGDGDSSTTAAPAAPPAAATHRFQTVFGDICATTEATPGCTFLATGERISVTDDPHHDRFSGGSDDLGWVEFNSSGVGTIYSADGSFVDVRDVTQFAGWVGGTQIGVGTDGTLWEDVRNGTYWMGKNGVLYSANLMRSNYGKAIN